MIFIKGQVESNNLHKEMILCRGMYGKKPMAKTILKDILRQNRSIIVLHISESLFKDWERTFKSLNSLAKYKGVQLLFDLKSEKGCDKIIAERKKPSNGLVPSEIIDATLRQISKK